MVTFLAIVGTLTIIAIVVPWLRLVWYRSKVLAVLDHQLGYKPDLFGPSGMHFNPMSRTGLERGWNEYDTAIAFMLVLLGVLPKPLNDKSRPFYEEKLQRCFDIAVLSTEGHALIAEFLAGPDAENT